LAYAESLLKGFDMFLSLPTIRRSLLQIGIGLFASFAAQADGPVRIGSKIDTEGKLLGTIMVLALEANGIKTENKVSLGNTKIVRTALLAGEIDLYPEYTGNGAFMLGAENSSAWKDFRAGYELAKKMDFQKNKIVWLEPANANNTWAIAVRKDLAASNKLRTMEDLGRYIAKGGTFKLAASAEFMERTDAMPAFQTAYGFKLRADQALVLAGGDTAATIKAAAEKNSGVNAAMAYGTDGSLAALGLLVMEDPKGVQPVYAPSPLVREEVLKRHPAIATILAPIFKSLDRPTLQMLNARIQLEGQDPRKVASEYLQSKGFLK
jgi:osmoprotectant transport system substrate-binding protein